MLYEFLAANRAELIALTQTLSSRRRIPRPTEAELKNGVPLFVEQLIAILQARGSNKQLAQSAALHGGDLLKMGITIAQVVHCYGDICQAVTELSIEKATPINSEDYRTFNYCLDDAIAEAVSEYARQRERTIAAHGVERMGVLAHELRNQLNTAMLSFEVLKSGGVGVSGSTGAVLGRSLQGLRELIDRSLAEVRIEAGIKNPERVSMAEFIEEIEIAAILEAKSRNLHLAVSRVDYGLAVQADRQLLASAVSNLLQNAFKFTRPGSKVSLKVHAHDGRVFIEVEDECGGIPAGKVEVLFHAFTQGGADRTGLGLGLSISSKAVAACGGTLRVDNRAGKGCTFIIELSQVS